jgi:hypothetical protein
MCRFLETLFVGLLVLSATIRTARAEEDAGDRYRKLADRPGISPLEKNVYEKLTGLHTVRLFFSLAPSPYQIALGDWAGPGKSSETNAFWLLCNIGLDALPALVDALDDETLTKTITIDLHTIKRDKQCERVWKVNELVALLICRISNRIFAVRHGKHMGDFICDIGKHVDRAPEFKKQVLDWYNENHNKTLSQRKIDDIESDVSFNRYAAVQWVGQHKEKDGQAAILRYVDELFDDERANRYGPTPIDNHLSVCAFALGQLGDRSTLEVVRRICKLTASRDAPYYQHYPAQQSLSTAYHGLALLGEKEEALRDLKTFLEEHPLPMHAADEFAKLLEEAKGW